MLNTGSQLARHRQKQQQRVIIVCATAAATRWCETSYDSSWQQCKQLQTANASAVKQNPHGTVLDGEVGTAGTALLFVLQQSAHAVERAMELRTVTAVRWLGAQMHVRSAYTMHVYAHQEGESSVWLLTASLIYGAGNTANKIWAYPSKCAASVACWHDFSIFTEFPLITTVKGCAAHSRLQHSCFS